jgi:hypothetical protein
MIIILIAFCQLKIMERLLNAGESNQKYNRVHAQVNIYKNFMTGIKFKTFNKVEYSF